MEEIEVPTEHLHEEILEKAEERKERWMLYIALSTAFMAVFAAISGLLAGHHSNEALIDQIKASDQWAYYQAKGIKSEIAASNAKIVSVVTKTPIVQEDGDKMKKYDQEKEAIKKTAEGDEADSEHELQQHMILAKSVTIFQIAIALSAISIVTRKKPLWYFSMLLAVVGIFFLVQGMIV